MNKCDKNNKYIIEICQICALPKKWQNMRFIFLYLELLCYETYAQPLLKNMQLQQFPNPNYK